MILCTGKHLMYAFLLMFSINKEKVVHCKRQVKDHKASAIVVVELRKKAQNRKFWWLAWEFSSLHNNLKAHLWESKFFFIKVKTFEGYGEIKKLLLK